MPSLSLETLVGFIAAFCTSASYLPQVLKCWRTRSAGDISLRMLLILTTGIALWVLYGVMRGDLVIVLANAASLAMLGIILFLKLQESVRRRPGVPARET